MVTDELLKYIKTERKSGKDDNLIREALKTASWKDEDINEGFLEIKNRKIHSYKNQVMFLIFINIVAFLALPLFVFTIVDDNGLGTLIAAVSVGVIYMYAFPISFILQIIYFIKFLKLKSRKWAMISVLPSFLLLSVIGYQFVATKLNAPKEKQERILNSDLLNLKNDFKDLVFLNRVDVKYREGHLIGDISFVVDDEKYFEEEKSVGINFDACQKNDISDERLKSYVDQQKKVYIILPEDFEAETSTGSNIYNRITFFSTKEHPIIVKDEFGYILTEFSDLNSRCLSYDIYTRRRLD